MRAQAAHEIRQRLQAHVDDECRVRVGRARHCRVQQLLLSSAGARGAIRGSRAERGEWLRGTEGKSMDGGS